MALIACPTCRNAVSDAAAACPSCGHPIRGVQAAPPPRPPLYPPPPPSSAPGNVDNNMLWAILSTLFCCLPLGVVAIIYSAQVDGKLARGDYAGAISSASTSRTLSLAAAGGGVLLGMLWMGLVFLGAVVG